jgi:hypothetical protein
LAKPPHKKILKPKQLENFSIILNIFDAFGQVSWLPTPTSVGQPSQDKPSG